MQFEPTKSGYEIIFWQIITLSKSVEYQEVYEIVRYVHRKYSLNWFVQFKFLVGEFDPKELSSALIGFSVPPSFKYT